MERRIPIPRDWHCYAANPVYAAFCLLFHFSQIHVLRWNGFTQLELMVALS